jgi:hypothetical protein
MSRLEEDGWLSLVSSPSSAANWIFLFFPFGPVSDFFPDILEDYLYCRRFKLRQKLPLLHFDRSLTGRFYWSGVTKSETFHSMTVSH